jgi:hypothetical protein
MARIANSIASMSLCLAPRLRWPRRVAGIRNQSFTGPLQLRRALTEKRKLAGKSHFRSNNRDRRFESILLPNIKLDGRFRSHNRDRQFEFTPLRQRVPISGVDSLTCGNSPRVGAIRRPPAPGESLTLSSHAASVGFSLCEPGIRCRCLLLANATSVHDARSYKRCDVPKHCLLRSGCGL